LNERSEERKREEKNSKSFGEQYFISINILIYGESFGE